jgi:HSP20 family molecular chaperone IbpA
VNNNYSLQEFSQTYSLPDEIKIDDLKSTYTDNGILSIEAPLVPKDPPKDREIKIERVK